MNAQPIEEYAFIGDCETGALVGTNGSIDWLCFPHFAGDACFAAILGGEDYGAWRIAPVGPLRRTRRAYRNHTVILETTFETDTGQVTLIDFMPHRTQQPELIRMVVGERGTVEMDMLLRIRFDYGAMVPWVQKTDGGIVAIAGPESVRLFSPVPLQGDNHETTARFFITAGERVSFILSWSPSHREPDAVINPDYALLKTEREWRRWADRCQFEGAWREQVVRSLITLKALTFAPTGGIVAAPTTSLPEKIGGVRNWDYRYCWIRDAAFALYAFLQAGYTEEAAAWERWLLRAVAGKPSQMQIVYGVSGERRLTEIELDWLPGYHGSKPVRIGNAASQQRQHDIQGQIMDVLELGRKARIAPITGAWELQVTLLEALEKTWREPDEGIWEVRGERRQFTHSKVMCWVAFDRSVKAIERFGLHGPLEHWQRLRDEIHAEVCAKGFDAELGAFVQYYGAKTCDASLLMIPLVGFLPVTDPRMVGTIAAIEQQLMTNGLVHRYVNREVIDGLPPGEGAFLPCTFWLVENYALAGRREEAQRLFEYLLSLTNDVGLLAEEYDPVARRQLGNFPQAFSHVGLVNAAFCLTYGGQAQRTA